MTDLQDIRRAGTFPECFDAAPCGRCVVRRIIRHLAADPVGGDFSVFCNLYTVDNTVSVRRTHFYGKRSRIPHNASSKWIGYSIRLDELDPQRIGHVGARCFPPEEGKGVPVRQVGRVGDVLQVVEIISSV